MHVFTEHFENLIEVSNVLRTLIVFPRYFALYYYCNKELDLEREKNPRVLH